MRTACHTGRAGTVRGYERLRFSGCSRRAKFEPSWRRRHTFETTPRRSLGRLLEDDESDDAINGRP